MVNADTNGLLRACKECGGNAGFEKDGILIRAKCCDCCNQTFWSDDKYIVVIEWNKINL